MRPAKPFQSEKRKTFTQIFMQTTWLKSASTRDSVKDLSSSYAAMRKITLTTLIGAFLLNGLLVYWLLTQQESQAKKVYVVTDHGTFVGSRKETRQVSVHEARNHVRAFLQTAFAHSAATYKENVERALHLIDQAGGSRLVHDFNKGEIYQNYVRMGTYTTLQVDSVHIQSGTRPFSGRAYAQQTIYLDGKQKAFPIAIRFELIETARSDQNPFGLLLQGMDYIPYHPTPANQ
jgi:hypothetical protein